MIRIDPTDCDFLCFFWVKDPCKLPYELIHLRFTRLVFGLCPSPAILGSVLTYHIKKFDTEFPELTKKLRDSFYVDDLITGVSDVQSALDFCVQSKKIMAIAGMNLRKWNLNELIQKLRSSSTPIKGMLSTSLATRNIETHETYARAVIGHGALSSLTQALRILEVIWDPSTDLFSFNRTQRLCQDNGNN